MATKKVSKTARASNPAAKMAGGNKFEMSGDSSRVIPLAAGEYAYVLTPAGRTVKTKVDSAEFVAGVAELAGTNAVRPTLAVLQRCAAQFANPGWSRAVNAIQGIDDTAAEDVDTTADAN
jgi:hypothetical protein